MIFVWLILLLIILFSLYWLFLSPYSQIFGPYPYHVKTKKKVIALTFDDGPNEPFTNQIIDFLNSKDIKSTFFVVGENTIRFPNTIKKMANSGHSIGVHSMNHKFANFLFHPSYSKEITQSIDAVYKITGKMPRLFRSPWLWRHPLLFKQLKEDGLKPISGLFSSNIEVFKPSAKYIAKTAINKAKPGSIIIFHDGYNAKITNRQKSVDAIIIYVNELLKQGYKFVTVDELLKLAK